MRDDHDIYHLSAFYSIFLCTCTIRHVQNKLFFVFRYNRSFTSDVVNATQNPVWKKKHAFVGVDDEEWTSSKLEISIWSYSTNTDHKCLGKTNICTITFKEFNNIIDLKFRLFYKLFSGITLLEPFRMDQSASNLSWYPLYSPTCTNSDLLYSTEHLHVGSSSSCNEEHQNVTGIPNSAETGNASLHRHFTDPTASLSTNVTEFTPSEQAYKWHRKLSDCGPSGAGNCTSQHNCLHSFKILPNIKIQ